MFGPVDPLLPGAACVGGGHHPRPGAGDLSWGQPRRNGESLALNIIRLGQLVLDNQGPPPGGGNSPRGIRGATLCLRRDASGPRDAPGGNLPA